MSEVKHTGGTSIESRVTARDIQSTLGCDFGTATQILQEADAETFEDLYAAARTHTIDGTDGKTDQELADAIHELVGESA